MVEALIKMAARWPRVGNYFKDGWNVFDFSVIVVSLLPSTGELATLARLARLFRVLRLVSALPGLRLIVATLIRSVPGMFNVLALMSIVFYVYGVAGYHLFHEIDPTHWRTLGIALLSLFRIVTLEDWTDIMYAALEHHWWAWIYFVSFVVVGTFVVINLFIAVVINSLDEAKQERLHDLQAPADAQRAAGGADPDAGCARAAAGAPGARRGLTHYSRAATMQRLYAPTERRNVQCSLWSFADRRRVRRG